MTRRRTTAARTAGVGFGTPGLVALLALLLMMATIVPAAAQWGDTEQATGDFQAATLEPPVIDTCVARAPLLGSVSVTITWRLPTGPPDVDHDLDHVVFRVEGTPVTPSTTGPDASGVYTSQFDSTLLGGILGGLLGAEFDIDMTTVHATWASPDAANAFVDIPAVLGGGASCTVTNA